jgi:hypothetical protein
MNITIKFILTLAYFIVGGIISAPYTYLANGGFENYILTQVIAPVAALFLVVVHMIERGQLQRKSRWTRMLGGWFFWVFVTYFCLPIIMNGASLLLWSMGFAKVGYRVFEFRYAAILLVPALLAVTILITFCATDMYERYKNRVRSPANIV